ncbi:MAG: hypothetical protein J0L85_09665 [Zoogloea sp.]|nr:hypothetical protein [Zoogloea sp.]MCA0186828.1 hypothetical protein [Pseudomonadota bacterium]
MTSANTRNPDLLDLMTSARREHDRAVGEFIHQIWQALAEALIPTTAAVTAHRAFQAHPLHPGP